VIGEGRGEGGKRGDSERRRDSERCEKGGGERLEREEGGGVRGLGSYSATQYSTVQLTLTMT
jgi:hypothetical protein